MKPQAILLRDLFPVGHVPQQLIVDTQNGKLCGIAFLFNSNGEPAMLPAETYDLPIDALLPK